MIKACLCDFLKSRFREKCIVMGLEGKRCIVSAEVCRQCPFVDDSHRKRVIEEGRRDERLSSVRVDEMTYLKNKPPSHGNSLYGLCAVRKSL